MFVINSSRKKSKVFLKEFFLRSPITIHTVEELQNALASDKNVQLVVSNELLDTPEFKALIQNMQETNIPEDIIRLDFAISLLIQVI